MRTSLIETQRIEELLLGLGLPKDRLLTEAEACIDPSLRAKIVYQRQALGVIRDYGRDKLRSEIRAMDRQLFTQPRHQSFQQRIRQIFQTY